MKWLLALILLGQGCVDEGPDHRLLGWLVCPMQRLTSFHSHHLPLWIVQHHDTDGNLTKGFAFPPYLIIQGGQDSDWHRFRFGWRYDVNWSGYIFPTAAIKRHEAGPLPKGY